MMWSTLLILSVSLSSAAELNQKSGLAKAIALLEKTSLGKQVMREAREKNLEIEEGKISKTEIVATRIVQGKVEKLDFHVQVLISTEKSPVFQAIDLAHELVHALHPKSNPFDPKLNAVDYIRIGIEAPGGEAHAILQECQVGQELVALVDQDSANLIKARCQYVWKTENNSAQWKLSFYHLGKYLDLFRSRLDSLNTVKEKKELMGRMIQKKDPLFTSAAANKPYPLALLDEYVEITKKICSRNQERKIASVSPMDARCQSLSSALFSP